MFSYCPFCSLFLSVPHCLCLPGLCLCLTISASLSVTHYLLSLSLTRHLLVISLPLSVSDSFTTSVSSPGLARPLGHGVTGRQGALRLFSALAGRGPSWAAVQESSSCPAPATRHSRWPLLPAHSVPSREHWGWVGWEWRVPVRLQLQDSPSWWPCSPPLLPPDASPPYFGA